MNSIQDNIKKLSKESEARTSENGNLQKLVAEGFSRKTSVIPGIMNLPSKGSPKVVNTNAVKPVDYSKGMIDWAKSGNIDLVGKGAPYVTPPAEDITQFNPYNVWDSEHITIDGTTTTVHDFNTFGEKYDMTNLAASNQPTYNAASANFNGLPSFTFDGVSQYFKTDVVNYRNTDTAGVFVSVFRHLSGSFIFELSLSQSNTTNRYFIGSVRDNSYRASLIPSILRSFRGDTNIEIGSPSSVVAYANAGTSYTMNINGNSETIAMISGENDGEAWLDTSSFDVLSIGGLVISSGLLYSNIEWCMAGYFPYTDESTTLNIVNFLKNKYGIV